MGAQGAEFGVCFTSSMEDWAALGATWETPRSGGLMVDELGYHGTGFVTHTGSDVEDLDHDGVVVGQADWMVISEAIHLDYLEREVLRRKCSRETRGFADAEMLQGDDYPSQRIVIFAKHRNVAVDVAMRCRQASCGQIRFRVLEAKSVYAAYEFERTLRQIVLTLPGIEQSAANHAAAMVKAGHAASEYQVRQFTDLARSVRAIIDDVVRVLEEAERIEEEKEDRATQIIKRFNQAIGHQALNPQRTIVVDAAKGDTLREHCKGGAYELKSDTSLRSVMRDAGKAGA